MLQQTTNPPFSVRANFVDL